MAQQIQQDEGWPLGLQPMHVRIGLAASNHEFSGSVSFNTLLTGSPTSSTDSSSDLDTEGRRGRGRPKKTLEETLGKDLEYLDLTEDMTQSRAQWRSRIHIADPTYLKRIRKAGYSYPNSKVRVSHQSTTYLLTRIRIGRVSARIVLRIRIPACQIRDTLVFSRSTGSFFHDRSITLGSLIGINSILELSRRSLRGRKSEHQAGKDRKTNNTTTTTTKFRITDGENVRHHQPSLGHFLAAERQAANESYRTNPPIYGPDDELALAEHHQPARESNNSLFVDGQVAPPQSSPWFGSDHADQRKSMLFSCIRRRRNREESTSNNRFLFFSVHIDLLCANALSIGYTSYDSCPRSTVSFTSFLQKQSQTFF
ncbi:hypothetical protein DVH24_038674 [Malus domestica]|uniref:Uncharacterized protein n=1 Tax=Malus domestica TaxID=3750 RepID=A0A498K808_MALDO|nr:hypothetical protein DVH24_038674 [Malus domestica]